ncbi:hypothetical protein [Bradyrhizobium sp. 172]|uniref:hypothetical protein n=1 Tax=Bradyrhizobium sp. 172 TaxID=2782643 RepID=UPI00200040A7|nr:hypothetical protein [Bradyrhizobium sp. 172]UPJ98303.1 hypothetical protein IVB07_12855 [Bradyrhizobium sp. 172]
MVENLKQPTSPEAGPSAPIPRFIQTQLDHPPIGPNESAAEFKSLFYQLTEAVQGSQRSAAECAMLFQATLLTVNRRSTGTPYRHPKGALTHF